ncbi:MAG: coproporphyrinogen III oxidase [Acidobacteria bacterium RIFCSPLOWO2_12_FULL_67_14b]|nr:MAG: coproporphyrinogen III oxidase [Acidobacteria bacterium RIFCSPLOWO2_12_FULL_67_14b]
MSGVRGDATVEQTDVGSYFIANYPPFSVWNAAAVATDAGPALSERSGVEDPRTRVERALGLYLHIPFCRKRCHFCYFRVYTDKNAREVENYLDLLAREWELYAKKPAVAGRSFNFVYFGGGTPSFLSTKQLQGLVGRLNAGGAWDRAEEITFECEPGTLTEAKLAAIRELGVTRLSLGVENFDDRILEINGRAHRSPEIGRAYEQARALGFPQINIDLIAGMLGETDANWQQCLARTLALDPDSVTIYQMELPYNTTISGDLLKQGGQFSEPVADWTTKRRWVKEAFAALERAGYHVGSAYTAVKNPGTTKFVYRDRLWEGADLLGLGVASFGHVNGVHMQNLDTWPKYEDAINRGEIPLGRAYRPTGEERLIREFVLQLKRGANRPAYFAQKYGVDVLDRFACAIESLHADGYLAERSVDRIALTREGLLRVDVLLPRFFLPGHASIRYT